MITSRNFLSILQRIWQIEINKINRKGAKNTSIAFLLLFVYFYYVPNIAQQLWPQQINNKIAFQFTATFTIHIILTILFSLIYLPGYLGVQTYKQYEIQPKLKKAWQKQNWKQMTKKIFWNLIVNYAVIFPAYLYTGLVRGGCMDFEHFPTKLQLIGQMCVILLADDFVEMVIHWTFHNVPFLYRYHKVHHEHETPFCLSTQYIHPVEQILGNFLPATIVFSIFNVHILVYFMWQGLKAFSSIESHSGYDFPWSPIRALPLVYGASYHYFHHTKNIGNYSTNFYIFQLFMGTNITFLSYDLDKQQKGIKIK